jgi:hypothetical protein
MIGSVENDTPLPMGRFNVAPFGPSGVINNNDLSTVGQGLKKMFKPQTEMPRKFHSNEKFVANKRGANSGIIGGGASSGGGDDEE